MNVKVYFINFYIFFQNHDFKYSFGSKAVKQSLQFFARHDEKITGVPTSDKTVPAAEAVSQIGSEITKAADASKKRRLETLDQEAVDNQTRQRRHDEEETIEETRQEEDRTMTGLAGSLAEDVVEDIISPTTLTPSKGIFTYVF